MYTIIPGLYPLASLLVGGVLYAVCRWALRLKCHSRWAQAYIALSMALTVAASLLTPARVVAPQDLAPAPAATDVAAPQPSVNTVSSTPEPLPAATFEAVRASVQAAPVQAPAGPAVDWTCLLADVWPIAGWLYLAGVAVVLLWQMAQVLWLVGLRRRYACSADGPNRIYHTDMASPFSFGRSIFLSTALSGSVRHYVLLHEQAHVGHHHSAKLVMMQVATAFCWYNPFAWLFCAEMRLQQELEVDGDVLRQGVDREDYQLSLLRVCTQEGKWIVMRTAYNLKPLKQRIIFMNKAQDRKSMRRHQLLAAACAALTVMAALIGGCQSHQTQAAAEADDVAADGRHHPMLGCWTMDWISNTGSGILNHPPAMHYGFYNDSTFLCFSYWNRKGSNIRFSMSGEGYAWRGDTLVDAQGHPTDYTLSDDGRTATSRWLKDSLQMAYVQGPDITEQWSRIEPDADIVGVFCAVSKAGSHTQGINGVWQHDDTFLLVNDTTMMMLNWYPSQIAQGFRYGASGLCGTFVHGQGDEYTLAERTLVHISQSDNNQLTITGDDFQETYQRVAMPAFLTRAFSPAVSIAETELQRQ